MFKFKNCFSATAALTITCLAIAPAKATTDVTYVSGKGTDSGNCSSPANPCRTFHFAVNQTEAGGEVKALDPADYRPVTINKSISITGVDGAGIDTEGGTGITVNSPAGTPTINLANLVIQNVSGSGTAGISVRGNPGLTGTIRHCTVRGFGTGISLVATPFATPGDTFLIADTVVTNNGAGIVSTFTASIIDHVVAHKNTIGIVFGRGFSGSTVVDTIISDNNQFGIEASEGTFLLGHSTVTGNGTGIGVFPPGNQATSSGDNLIYGNGTNVSGTLTKVGAQ